MNSFLIVLTFLPGFFGYGSKAQAKVACYEWRDKGVKHEYVRTWYDGDTSNMIAYARKCVQEPETNQYLGYEYEKVKKAKNWKQGDEMGDRKVVKNFRY